METTRDVKRSRSDVWENCIWPESIAVDDREFTFFQAIHQEAVTIPENIDAIRAMMELEPDGAKSIEKINKALGLSNWPL